MSEPMCTQYGETKIERSVKMCSDCCSSVVGKVDPSDIWDLYAWHVRIAGSRGSICATIGTGACDREAFV